jgi:hypothetical protein
MDNILRTVTIMWSAIIRALGFNLPFCRECWSFSEIRGFLFVKHMKGNEKNEKNCKNDEPGYDPGNAADPDRLRRFHR